MVITPGAALCWWEALISALKGPPTFSWAFFLDAVSIQLSSSRVSTNTARTLSMSSLTWGSTWPLYLDDQHWGLCRSLVQNTAPSCGLLRVGLG